MEYTYSNFQEDVYKNYKSLGAVPEQYLNENGLQTYRFYFLLFVNFAFAPTAADLLELIKTDDDFTEFRILSIYPSVLNALSRIK